MTGKTNAVNSGLKKYIVSSSVSGNGQTDFSLPVTLPKSAKKIPISVNAYVDGNSDAGCNYSDTMGYSEYSQSVYGTVTVNITYEIDTSSGDVTFTVTLHAGKGITSGSISITIN